MGRLKSDEDFILQEQLQHLMYKERVSLHNLSTKLSMSKSTLHSWINGVKPQGVLALFKIAQHFDTSIEELCFGEPLKHLEFNNKKPTELKITLKFEGSESIGLSLGSSSNKPTF